MKDKKQKDVYEAAELDIVLLKANDVIVTSIFNDDDVADDDWTNT